MKRARLRLRARLAPGERAAAPAQSRLASLGRLRTVTLRLDHVSLFLARPGGTFLLVPGLASRPSLQALRTLGPFFDLVK